MNKNMNVDMKTNKPISKHYHYYYCKHDDKYEYKHLNIGLWMGI